ncbi:MAG: fluoride efflux transporter CrcB [Nostocoides sp.]
MAALSLGGVLGALGRYAVALALPTPSGHWPMATFVVNIIGSFAMGVLVAYLVDRPGAHPLLRPFVGVGVLGGWTTYSSFALEAVALAEQGNGGVAVAYVAGSFLIGIAAVAAGSAIGARWWPVRT